MSIHAPRAAVGLLLIALLFVGPLTAPDPGRPLRVDSETSVSELARVLADAKTRPDADRGARPARPRLTYADARAPSGALAAVLASADFVTLRTPGVPAPLTLEAPRSAVAGRRTALDLTLRGEPGATRSVTIESTGGIVDTVSASIGPDGTAYVRMGVEAAREGAASWIARSANEEVTARAWVRPPEPVRVLTLTGPPSLESRHLVRALESADADVQVRTDLGRDLAVSTGASDLPRSFDDLADVDVVVLVEPVEAPVELLTRWVEDVGGGLLRVVPASSGPGRTGSLVWSGPPEIVPLPDSEVETGGRPAELWPEAAHALTTSVVRGEADAPLAVAGWLGRGRVYVSGLSTWPWVMEAGRNAEHGRHWESVVEWLAGGLRNDHALAARRAVAGVAWTGRIEGVAPFEDPLVLDRPAGSAAPDRVGPSDRARSTDESTAATDALGAILRALPVRPGAYTLRDAGTADAPGRFGFVAAPSDEALTWSEAALVIGAEGGTIVPTAADGERDEEPSRPLRSSTVPRALLFLALAALSGGAWTSRRVAGLT